ncbi:hypothetical protein C9374_006826 [Naegleria lovaniensis]|uniref:Uncharacterized protein n=1 Tax=Naegleria lovaniensis TaxID=51637 RepID=A0AA88KXJ8_NAELO|nr:uncharacterized protein C9374_006826 [Naegleria lovaniensis]KAG2393295.1 hypothetical protein C9374_006826 [Naegleria lovaniensis]
MAHQNIDDLLNDDELFSFIDDIVPGANVASSTAPSNNKTLNTTTTTTMPMPSNMTNKNIGVTHNVIMNQAAFRSINSSGSTGIGSGGLMPTVIRNPSPSFQQPQLPQVTTPPRLPPIVNTPTNNNSTTTPCTPFSQSTTDQFLNMLKDFQTNQNLPQNRGITPPPLPSSQSSITNPYFLQIANLNKQQQAKSGMAVNNPLMFIQASTPPSSSKSSSTKTPPSIPPQAIIAQLSNSASSQFKGFSTVIGGFSNNAASNNSTTPLKGSTTPLSTSVPFSLVGNTTPPFMQTGSSSSVSSSSTPPMIPPNFFSQVSLPPPVITPVLPSSTKGLLEISLTKPGKKWPKLLSEIQRVEVQATNFELWKNSTASDISSIRCYVPDFGSDFDSFEDDDFDDDDDDMFVDGEYFNNVDEESFDLSKFEKVKSQGVKRTRSGASKSSNKNTHNSCVYLFSANRELIGYVSSMEYNDCLVPLSKHKIIMVSVSNSILESTGRYVITLKVFMVKKALVSDKNLLESSTDSNESNLFSVANIERMSDEQIQMYHVRKNFLKKLFDLLDRNSGASIPVTGSSSSINLELLGNSTTNSQFSKLRKTVGSDVSLHKSKQEEEDDLDALDDTDLDEYIIQKPTSQMNASSSSFHNLSDMEGEGLDKQLEELYEEIEKVIVDDENAVNTDDNSDDEPEISHHAIEIPEDSLLTSELRSYQKTAVKWMLKRERIGEDKAKSAPKLHSLFQERKFPDGTPFYFNPLHGVITLTFVPAPPEPKGGILADEMGLGKTVEVIGLIASNRIKGKKTTPTVVGDKYFSSATLVVTPLTIVDQWKQEIERHTNNQLSVYVYQGNRRIRDVATLLKYDVIITTYNTLSYEYSQTFITKERANAKKKTKDTAPQQPSPIYKMKFFRVVLDEAHNIKNRKSLQSRATAAVDAERRWAVTGTPIQNHIDDLYSLFHFLKVNPHGDWRWWTKYIGKPFEKKDKKAIGALQSVIKKLVIRRTKNKRVNGKRIVELPKKHVETVSIQFSQAEMTFYKSLYEYSKGKFNEFVRSNTVLKNYANILEMLLHLRQVCNHPALIITSFQKKTDKSTMNGFLENFEQKNGFEVYDTILPMLPQVLKLNKEKLKMRQNNEGESVIASQLKSINVSKYMKANWRSSSKINALIEKLRSQEYGTKSVVFSQWTSMLDLVEVALEKSGIRFVRLDGKMQRKDRDDAVQKFKHDNTIQVCLISLKVGGTGLNLVWATHVFLLDPWWNPAIEEQAIDRVHRIGQDKPVTVYRFVVKDSVEERILSLQKSKTKIANDALNIGSDDDEDETCTTYGTSYLGGFGGGALKSSRKYDSDEEFEDDDDGFDEVTIDDQLDDEEEVSGGMFGHTKKDAQKLRLKELTTIFV